MLSAETRQKASCDAEFYRQVSETIGGTVTPQKIESIVDRLNSSKQILHGIKYNRYFPSVLTTGILPLTPESKASHWTTGKRAFGSLTDSGKINTFDTSFFHYAHSYDGNSKLAYMTLALTNEDLLDQPVTIRPDCELTISTPVARDSMALLRIELGSVLSGRQKAQCAEQEMLNLLDNVLSAGYGGGELFERKVFV